MLPPLGDRSLRVLKGCAHTSALGHELDDWGIDAQSLGCGAGAADRRGGVNGEKESSGVKRCLAYRLQCFLKLHQLFICKSILACVLLQRQTQR
jgi:hypothetical protein